MPNPNGSVVFPLDSQLLLPNENEGRGACCCGNSSSGSDANRVRGFSGVLVVLSILSGLMLKFVGDGEEEKVSVGTELLELMEDEDNVEDTEVEEVEDVSAGGVDEGTEEEAVVMGRLLRVRAGALR